MKKYAIVLIIVVLILSGCSGGLDKDKISEFADPMVENVLQGLNDGDYASFSKDFGPIMMGTLNEEFFNTYMKENVVDIIGQYESKELVKATRESQDGVDYIVAIYKAKYSIETGDIAITVWFTDDENNRKIETLLFNSPKLIESSK